jgi:hypothetical protein
MLRNVEYPMLELLPGHWVLCTDGARKARSTASER